MKILYLLIVSTLIISCSNQEIRSYQESEKGVTIALQKGTLGIYPIAENAVRINFYEDTLKTLPELIFTSGPKGVDFQFTESGSYLEIKTSKMQVQVNKKTGIISYADESGTIFLNEKAGSRIIKKDSVMGEACYNTQISFDSPDDEYIFGLGQFQDGQYNLRKVSRRLTQVNSQIALPFIYSNKGYGLLWHQYGLTEYNPADYYVTLEKQEQKQGDENLAEVTTTSGTRRVAQNQSFYKGSFTIPEDGEYSLFLDLGGMGNRHFVVIDDKTCLDQSNIWLPPTAGFMINLKEGEHKVQVLCKSDNTPKLSWKPVENQYTFRSPHTKQLDYVVFYGPEADSVIASYRNLSGNAPMLPKWAYGFWQCRERYTSGKHLVETVKEFRKRKLPMDVIVQDWQYWGKNGWGVPKFDETNYPNPKGFIKELHDLNSHLTVSIWSNPDKNSEIGRKFVENDRFVPNTKWLDYFNPDTRKEYWNTLKENLFDAGVDAWWMDATEPENDALTGEITFQGPGDFYRLSYPLLVCQSVYEGQRNVTSDKRVCILTRSAFLGQQRYGSINWSGDIGGTWDAYQRQIVAGLNFSLTGLPYWTTDIGGFFRPGRSQYTDENFHELLIRWYQWGTFNPIFRIHGYMTETEPWKYGQNVEDNMRKMLNLRYRLIPYIYSEASNITRYGSTMMRPLIMDFREDNEAVDQAFEYMFGKSILVSPIVVSGVKEWNVYLPEKCKWYDFWTGEVHEGGKYVIADAPMDKLPLFVKAGSIIPLGEITQYTSKKTEAILEIRIYNGDNGQFELYEDEGDNYNYEKGDYTTISFSWDDTENILTIGNRKGGFPGMPVERKFNIILVNENNGTGIERANIIDKEIQYTGQKIQVQL